MAVQARRAVGLSGRFLSSAMNGWHCRQCISAIEPAAASVTFLWQVAHVSFGGTKQCSDVEWHCMHSMRSFPACSDGRA